MDAPAQLPVAVDPDFEQLFTPLNQLTDKTEVPWSSKVMVIEKNFPRDSMSSPRKFQNLTFVDEQGNRMQATIFGRDIETYKNTLLINRQYIVSNAPIKHSPVEFRTVPYDFQMTISNSTLIDEVMGNQMQVRMGNIFAPLSTIPGMVHGTTVNVLGVVIEAMDPGHTKPEKGGNKFQEFLMMDNRMDVIKLKLWHQFVDNEGSLITSLLDTKPIVAGLRLRTMAGQDPCVSSWKSCCFLINPNVAEADEMRLIVTKNRKRIGDIAGERSLKNALTRTTTKVIPKTTIDQIQAATSENTYVVDCTMIPIKVTNKGWYMGCSNCMSGTSAAYLKKFMCHNCSVSETFAMPRAKIEAKIEDPTGTLEGAFFGEDAEAIYGLTAQELFHGTIKEQLTALDKMLSSTPRPTQTIKVRVSLRTGKKRCVFSLTGSKEQDPKPLAIKGVESLEPKTEGIKEKGVEVCRTEKIKGKEKDEEGEETIYTAKRRLEFEGSSASRDMQIVEKSSALANIDELSVNVGLNETTEEGIPKKQKSSV